MVEKVLAKRLRSVRAKLGESQDEFGKRFGVNQSTVQRWETRGLSDRGTTKLLVRVVLSQINELRV